MMMNVVTTLKIVRITEMTATKTAAITKARGPGDTGTVRASRGAGRALSLQAITVSINATGRVVWNFGTAVCCSLRISCPMYRCLVAWNILMGPSTKVNGIVKDAYMESGGILLQLVALVSGTIVLVCIATRANSGATAFMDTERWCGPTLAASTRDTGRTRSLLGSVGT